MRRFRPLVGTLAYVWDRSTDHVLQVRRNARAEDENLGKVMGLGGKVEPDEHVVDGMRRELHEEALIEVTSLRLRGTITWTGFGPSGSDWLGFVFLVDGWTGTPPEANDEGTLEWVERERLLAACTPGGDPDLPMWAGDHHFIPLVFDDDPRQFHGTMPYDGERPRSWTVDRL
ncbi:MAG: 8-oxo-dGTP diphosphatase [Actinomycetota bacterium]